MSAPSWLDLGWLRWALAGAMIAVALYHLARLVESRVRRVPARLDVDLTHAAMGAVMTAMLVGTLGASDSRRLALLFAVPALWFAWRGMHSYVMDGPRAVGASVPHVIGCAAMVYMLVGLAGSGAGPAMTGMAMPDTSSAQPVLGGFLVAATLAVAMWTAGRMRMLPRAAGATVAPALTAGCQLAMNATTVYMLMAM